MELPPPINQNITYDVIKERLAMTFDQDPIRFIVSVGMFISIETIGNASLACIILYERFGMDPQKRTSINQLLSKLCWLFIICNITVCPLVATRYFVSPIGNTFLAAWILFAIVGAFLASGFAIAEMTVLKCLYIFAWPKMAMIDDNFLSALLHRVNCQLCIMAIGIRLCLGEHETNPFYLIIIGEEPPELGERNYLYKNAVFTCFHLPIALSFLVFIIGNMVIGVNKLKSGSTSPRSTIIHHYNNQTQNDNLLSSVGISILGVLLFAFTSSLIVMPDYVQSSVLKYFQLIIFYVPSILLPFIYFMQKPKCLKSIYDLYCK